MKHKRVDLSVFCFTTKNLASVLKDLTKAVELARGSAEVLNERNIVVFETVK